MNTYASKTRVDQRQSTEESASLVQRKSRASFDFIDNRPEAVAQRKLQKLADDRPEATTQSKLQELTSRRQEPIQKVNIGTINCPNWGNVMDLGSAIHGKLQADYIQNGTPHATWLRGAEFTTPTGQKADLTLRTPAHGFIRSVGEIKPVASQAAGALQIATHLANMPANGLNAVNPVINDAPWAAGASFPVTDLDAAGGSPSGNVNVTPVAATPGLYTYNG